MSLAAPGTRVFSRRVLLAAIPLLLAALVSIAGVWYSVYLSSPEHNFRRALSALSRGERHEAQRLAGILEQRGSYDQVHFIRGQAALDDGRSSFLEAARFRPLEGIEPRLLYMLDAATLMCQPFVPRWEVWFYNPAAALALRGQRLAGLSDAWEERGRAAMNEAAYELDQIGEASFLFPEAAALLGEALIRLGRWREAVLYLDKAVAADPDLVQAHRLLATLHYDLGSMSAAIRHSQEVGRLDPGDGRPFRFIGQINKDHYRIQAAIEAYEEALRRELSEAARAEVLKEFAEVQITHAARYEEALKLIAQCPEPFANQPEMQSLRAECLWRLGKEKEALDILDRVLTQAPDLRHAVVLKGVMLRDADRLDEAIAFLERGVAMDPHDHKTRNYLAGLYQSFRPRLGRLAAELEAAAAYASVRDPAAASVADAAGGMARVLYESYLPGRYEEQVRQRDLAQERLDKLTRLSVDAMNRPWDAQVRWEIAQLWLQMDRIQLARSWLQAALACDPEMTQAQQALEKLKD